MAEHEVRLCRSVIQDHFGVNAEKVACVLLKKGRLTLPNIGTQAKLTPKQVRECLFVLIQHHAVSHSESTEGNRVVTYYQTEPLQILLRIRIPRYIAVAEKRFDQTSAIIITQVLKHGRLTYKDVVSFLQDQLIEEVKHAFSKLIEERYLLELEYTDSVTTVDKHIASEKAEVDKMPAPPTSHELSKIRKNLAAVAMREEYENGGPKRKRTVAATDDHPHKMRALLSHTSTTYFRVDYERFHIHLRNEAFADYLEEMINASAGAIMRTIAQHTERDIHSCKHDERTRSLTTFELLRNLPSDRGLVVDTLPNLSRQGQLNEYLTAIVETSSRRLLVKSDDQGGGVYTIPLQSAATLLQQRLVEEVIREKYGGPSCRMYRLLLQKGKLDEKQVAKLAMVPIKSARANLYELFNAGLINMQDVPRTVDHSASRTFFLWHANLTHTIATLTTELIRTLANIRQNRQVEVEQRKVLLQKLDRTDVDLKHLTSTEMAYYEKMKKVLRRLDAAEARADEMVLFLRDFA